MWLYRQQLDPHISFGWQYVVLVKICEENPASWIYVLTVGKERSILIDFSANCGHFPLILHQNSTRSIFLNGSCNVEYETMSVNFLYSIILKSIDLPCILNGSSTYDFVTSFGHLENIGSLNYTDLSNIDTIHYTRLTIIFVSIIRKSFKYWESVKFMIVHTSFLKF